MPPHLDHVHEVRDFKSFTSVFDQFSENSNSFKLRVLTGLHGAEQTMNSDELLCRALSLGHHLLSIGIRAGDRIAIIAPSSPYGSCHAGMLVGRSCILPNFAGENSN